MNELFEITNCDIKLQILIFEFDNIVIKIILIKNKYAKI